MFTSNIIKFAKINALGNKILVIDLIDYQKNKLLEDNFIKYLALQQKTEFEQLMVIYNSSDKDSDFDILIYNNDASSAGACGNGMRAVTFYLNKVTTKKQFYCRTVSDILKCEYHDIENIAINMGKPDFNASAVGLKQQININSPIILSENLPGAFLVSMGNPHAVFFLDDMPNLEQVKKEGPRVENHAIFSDKCNVSFAFIKDYENIILRTWERNAGLTQACGSASCASYAVARSQKLCANKVNIELLGGALTIYSDADNNIIMQGAVELEHFGEIKDNQIYCE